jgi:hypothetical protein
MVPDSVEPVVGWRVWFVKRGETKLRPYYFQGLWWRPREAFEAVCPQHAHDAPAEGCNCGIYTVREPHTLEREFFELTNGHRAMDAAAVVAGQVKSWGKVVHFDRGWKSQFAYPAQLYLFGRGLGQEHDAKLGDELSKSYGVPVVVNDSELERILHNKPTPEELATRAALERVRREQEERERQANLFITLAKQKEEALKEAAKREAIAKAEAERLLNHFRATKNKPNATLEDMARHLQITELSHRRSLIRAQIRRLDSSPQTAWRTRTINDLTAEIDRINEEIAKWRNG